MSANAKVGGKTIELPFIDPNQNGAFVAYLCAGDPDFDTSLAACRAVIDAGADVLELGVPFSDPLADGLTNQLAAQRALDGGMTAGPHLRLGDLMKDRP